MGVTRDAIVLLPKSDSYASGSGMQEWNSYWHMKKATDEEVKAIENPNHPEAQKILAKYKEVSKHITP